MNPCPIRKKLLGVVVAVVAVAVVGCYPTRPHFFGDDADLSHYLDLPKPESDCDVCQERTAPEAPLTLENAEDFAPWELSLNECIHMTLENSEVIRTLGGRFGSIGALRAQIGEAPDLLLTTPDAIVSVYDPAIQETQPFTGVGAALSAFDPRLNSNVFWERNERPQNLNIPGIFVPEFLQEFAQSNTELSKVTPIGTIYTLRSNTIYDANNRFGRPLRSDWQQSLEVEATQPLLQGLGVPYNAIAGPFNPFQGTGNQNFDGVVLARMNTDVSLAEFECQVRDLLCEVEDAYWELYFAYRYLEAQRSGLEFADESWRNARSRLEVGTGNRADEAQARAEFYRFRSEVERALTDVHAAENRLRWLMGIEMSDGRLIRPADAPAEARVEFDWHAVYQEALVRSCELRRQRIRVRQREMEILAAKNELLPRLDAFGRYRWFGLGDQWLGSSAPTPQSEGSSAYDVLFGGDFQEWRVGLQLSVPLFFRQQWSQLRHFQLRLSRERALLFEQELELSHQLGDAIRNLIFLYEVTQTNDLRRRAAAQETETIRAAYEEGLAGYTLDVVLDSERRRADAEAAYYRSLVDYNRAIARVHCRKNSTLDYHGINLAETPWPGRTYYTPVNNTQRRALDYLDYGFCFSGLFDHYDHLKVPGVDGPIIGPGGTPEELIESGEPVEVLPPGEVQEGIPGPPAGGDAPHSVMPPGDAPLEAPMAPAAPMNSSPMPPEPVLLMPKDPTADAGGELLRLPKVEDI